MNLRETRPLKSSVALNSVLSLCTLSCYQICFGGTIRDTMEGSVLNAQGSGVGEKNLWMVFGSRQHVLPGTAFVFLTNSCFFSLGLSFHCLYDLCLPYSR